MVVSGFDSRTPDMKKTVFTYEHRRLLAKYQRGMNLVPERQFWYLFELLDGGSLPVEVAEKKGFEVNGKHFLIKKTYENKR